MLNHKRALQFIAVLTMLFTLTACASLLIGNRIQGAILNAVFTQLVVKTAYVLCSGTTMILP